MKLVELPLCGAKKNDWAISKHGGIYTPKPTKKEQSDLAWLMKGFEIISKDKRVNLALAIDLKQGKMFLGIEPAGPYDLPRHDDLTGILETVGDALQESRRIFNDSRITAVRAYFR